MWSYSCSFHNPVFRHSGRSFFPCSSANMTGEMQEKATMFERSSRDLTSTKLGVYGNPTTKNFHHSIEALFRANWPTPYEPLWALAIRFIWIKTILLGVPLVTKLYFFGGKLCILTPIFWASGCVYWHLTLRHLTAGTLGIIHNQLHVPQSSVSLGHFVGLVLSKQDNENMKI